MPDRNMKSPLRGRTRLEQLLIIFIVILFICLLAVSITLGIRDRQRHNVMEDHCVKKECLNAAADLISSRNMEIDPCENFYNYTCENWIKNSVYHEDMTDRFSTLDDDMNLKLKALLDPEELPDGNPVHFQKAHLFYQTCMNLDERMGSHADFLHDLEVMGGYPALKQDKWNPDDFNYLEMLEKMKDVGLDDGVFLEISISIDFKNNSMTRVMMTQPKLGLTKPDYFGMPRIVNIYNSFLSSETLHLCQKNATICPKANKTAIMEELLRAIELEKKLAAISLSELQMQDKDIIYNVLSVEKLQEHAPGIYWLPLLRIYFPSVTMKTEIIVATPDYMRDFAQIISEFTDTADGKRSLANYLMYRATKDVSRHLTTDMRQISDEFSTNLFGTKDATKYWVECMSFTSAVFDLALASIYAKKFIPERRKAAMNEMMEDIRAELKEILLHTPWMDDNTRNQALLKLEKIYPIAAYPDDLLNDTRMDSWFSQLAVGSDHYENYKNAQIFMREQMNAELDKPVDKSGWSNLPGKLLEAQAVYYPNNNSIFVPLGICQDWFFEEDNPKYLNYARIGFVIAHEFGHAFDSDGADYDENGNLRNWWKNDTREEFKKSSKCMVDIFDHYFVPEANKTLNGTQTLTENIADDLGLAEAYRAFVKASAKNPDPPLPGVDLNANQLFWLNAAAVWCSRQTPDVLEEQVASDTHSPGYIRVQSTLTNNADFVRDFNCKVGSGMNPSSDKCHVWGVD